MISVIVPCYNQSSYLNECLESVLNQTYKDWECIIVNDGSPDNTEEIALAWTKKDSRFKYIFQENSGVSVARNNGIDNSTGEWILPLDGDDKISSSYLEKAIIKIKEGYHLIYSNAIYFGEKNEEWILEDYEPSKLLYHNIIFCSAIFKKNNIRFDSKMTQGFEDWEFWVNYIFSAENIKIYKLDSFEFYYRIKNESRNKSVNNDYEKALLMKDYVYCKHIALYNQYLGSYFTIYDENKSLKRQIMHLKSILDSKRVRLLNKFLSFFSK